MLEEFPTQKVIELACAAYRAYGDYLKEVEYKYDSDGKFLFVKYPNKEVIKYALGIKYSTSEQEFRPIDLFISPEDRQEAEDIKKYYRKLMFSAVNGRNKFETELNAIIESETVDKSKIGWIACLPKIYRRDSAKSFLEKKLKTCEPGYLAEKGALVLDKDCNIIKVSRSRSFDAWNVYAIIDNKLVSWMSSKEVTVGDAVVIQAKVKVLSVNSYLTSNRSLNETRMHYVKVAQ